MPSALPLFFRPLGGGDAEMLVDAALGNFNWRNELFTVEQMMRRPDLARYAEFDAGRGDFGVVAVSGDRPIGVAWALYLPHETPGYGWIDPITPEFCVWVEPSWRGRGIGRTLTRQLLAAARARVVPRVSLSVDRDNMRARLLYMDMGFFPVPGGERYGVLLWRSPEA